MMTIRWDEVVGDPRRIAYFVDGAPVGDDDLGFNRILELLRADRQVAVTLRVKDSAEFAGGTLTDALPFGARIDELRSTLGERTVVYEFG
jgi:hypothetical protein